PQASGLFTGLTAGIYTLEVTDANGCTDNMTIDIIEPASLVISEILASHVDVDCNGNANGELEVSATDGTAPYSYTLDGGVPQASGLFTGLAAGTYTLEVTDANGCTDNMTLDIIEPASLVISEILASHVDVDCNGNANGELEVTATDGTAPYTYTLDAGAPQASGLFIGLAAGTYTLEVTDDNACTANIDITINENPVLTVSIPTSVDVTCNGDCDGSATALGNGGDGSYTYDWSNGETTASISGLCAGTYSVTVYDGNSCSAVASVTINENPTVTASISAFNDATIAGVCDGDATVLAGGGDGTYTYLWSDSQNTATATGLCAGTYTVTVYDGNGCSAITSVVIEEPDALVLSIVGTDVTCNGDCDGESTVTPTGGVAPYSYIWSNGQITQTAINLCAGTYQVTVEDANGALETASITINENLAVTATVTASTDISCNGGSDGSATVTPGGGTGAYTYLWSNTQTTATVNNLSADTYTVTVYDGNMCEATTSVTINENPEVTAVIATSSDVTCNGGSDGSATVTPGGGTGAYTYLWSNTQTAATVNNLSANTYTVTVYDGNMCEATASVIISENPAVTASIATSTDVTCNGGSDGSATVTPGGGTGAYTYLWSNSQTSATATNLSAGTYSVTVYDGNMCEAISSVVIDENAAVVASITNSSDVLCYGDCNGSATVNASGGDNDFSYAWNDPMNQTTATATALCPGNYSVAVTDGLGCSDLVNVTIGQPVQMSLTVYDVENVTCYGSGDGSITVGASGGVGTPYTYSWVGSTSTLPVLPNVAGGTYIVTAEDQNGCTVSETITVQEPDELVINENPTNVQCGMTPGSCNVSVTGGNGGYVYSWDGYPTVTGPTLSGLGQGAYTVNAQDALGCSSQATMVINTMGSLAVTINEDIPITCFGESNAALSAQCSNGAEPLEYFWNPTGSTNYRIENLSSGIYSVQVSDNWGCVGSDSHHVIEPNPIVPNFDVDAVACYNGLDGQVTVNAAGGTMPYTYIWDGVGVNDTIIGLQSGWYFVLVQDAHNCSVNDSVFIGQPDSPLQMMLHKENISCYGDNDGSIRALAHGGTAPYVYEWFAENEISNDTAIYNLPEGFYSLIITDANACLTDTMVAIQEPAPLIVDYMSTNPSCIGNNDGYIEIEVVGGTEPYVYIWDMATASLPYFDGLYEGSHEILVQDANGCEYDLETITLMDVPEECLRIPDAFTPNGDDNNDTWIIENLDLFNRYHVQVFNRWGQALYEGKPGSEPWDGTTTEGKPAPTGSYIYIINLHNGSKPKTGIVTVVY
nr:gliding motility-associated C-terminal domain-containing protein [Bacteroidales bacterium]